MKLPEMKSFLSNSFAKAGIYAQISVGIAIIAGTFGVALAYLPTKFLAVPVASFGSLLGAFICANAFSKNREKSVHDETDKRAEEIAHNRHQQEELEKARKDNDAKDEEIRKLREEKKNLERCGAQFTSFHPTLELTFLKASYKMTDYRESSTIVKKGKSGGLTDGWLDTDPVEELLQSVYYVKGVKKYFVDLKDVRVKWDNGILCFPKELDIGVNTLIPEEEEFLLRQSVTTTWDYDKNKGDEPEGYKGKDNKPKEVNFKNLLHVHDEFEDTHKSNVKKELCQGVDEYKKNFGQLAEAYIRGIFSAGGITVEFSLDKENSEDGTPLEKVISDINQARSRISDERRGTVEILG